MSTATPNMDEFIELCGGREAVERMLADHLAATNYIEEHRAELTARYPDETIAVHRDKVVAHSADPDEFDRQFEATGIPSNRMVVETMLVDPPMLLV